MTHSDRKIFPGRDWRAINKSEKNKDISMESLDEQVYNNLDYLSDQFRSILDGYNKRKTDNGPAVLSRRVQAWPGLATHRA